MVREGKVAELNKHDDNNIWKIYCRVSNMTLPQGKLPAWWLPETNGDCIELLDDLPDCILLCLFSVGVLAGQHKRM